MLTREQLEKFAADGSPGIIVVREGQDDELIRSISAVKPARTLGFCRSGSVNVSKSTTNEQELR